MTLAIVGSEVRLLGVSSLSLLPLSFRLQSRPPEVRLGVVINYIDDRVAEVLLGTRMDEVRYGQAVLKNTGYHLSNRRTISFPFRHHTHHTPPRPRIIRFGILLFLYEPHP